MAAFDVDAFIERFRERAAAVRERGIPPLEGQARRRYVEAAEQDHMDYSLVAAAEWSVEGGNWCCASPCASRPPSTGCRPGIRGSSGRRGGASPAAGLGPALRLEPLQAVVAGVHEAHGGGHGPVAGLVADEAVHLGADPAVAGMAPGLGAQLQQVEGLAGVELDAEADAVGEGHGVLGGIRAERLGQAGMEAPGGLHGPAPSASSPASATPGGVTKPWAVPRRCQSMVRMRWRCRSRKIP